MEDKYIIILLLIVFLIICGCWWYKKNIKYEWINKNIWGDTDLNPKNITFVQIGSNCGTTECAVCGEPIWEDCKKNMWNGIVVEPTPYIYEKLVKNYKYNPNVTAINCALSNKNGYEILYSDGSEASSLSEYHANKHNITKYSKNYKEYNVKTYDLNTFWNIYVKFNNVDILNLDCEGYDDKIILSTNFNKLNPKPKYILYEAKHIEDRQSVLNHLKKYNYIFFKNVEGCGEKDFDTLVKYINK